MTRLYNRVWEKEKHISVVMQYPIVEGGTKTDHSFDSRLSSQHEESYDLGKSRQECRAFVFARKVNESC
jgi:hypothetical protein